jgi:hypothetical protein
LGKTGQAPSNIHPDETSWAAPARATASRRSSRGTWPASPGSPTTLSEQDVREAIELRPRAVPCRQSAAINWPERTPARGGSDPRGRGRGPRRSRPTPPRRRGRSRCASHPAPNAPRRAGRGSRPSSSAPRRQPRPMPRSGARHGTMPWLRWRAPREAGAAVRITSAQERIESLRLARRAERSRDRLTCEATAGIVPEAATVAPAGVDESGASVPSYPLMR